MKYDTTAMILAAGLGTRLKSLTQDKPKALVELKGKPLLQHCIENLTDNGFHHIVINVHHFGEQIIDFVEHHNFNADIQISDERKQLLDTGGGIIKATPLFKDSKAVLVHNVDLLITPYFLKQAFCIVLCFLPFAMHRRIAAAFSVFHMDFAAKGADIGCAACA